MKTISSAARIQMNTPAEKFDKQELVASFGIGCFHFGQKSAGRVNDFDVKNYVEEVKQFLSSYTNIEKIYTRDLRYTKYWISSEDHFDDDEFYLNDRDGILPWPMDWRVEFTVQISHRIQNQILDEFSISALETEKFRVSLRYENDLPVAFVYGASPLSSPSDAVILIREYLKKNAPKDGPIVFQLLGPSPFHADFFVFKSEEEGFEKAYKPGYDRIMFLTKKSAEDFCKDIEPEIAREIGLFYAAIQQKNLSDIWWNDFALRVGESIEAIKQPRKLLRRLIDFAKPPEINDLALELLQYEMEVRSTARNYTKILQDMTVQYGLERFSDYVQEIVKQLKTDEVEQFRTIVGVIDSHKREMIDYRVSLIAAFIGLLAACLGGIAGALLTFSLTP